MTEHLLQKVVRSILDWRCLAFIMAHAWLLSAAHTDLMYTVTDLGPSSSLNTNPSNGTIENAAGTLAYPFVQTAPTPLTAYQSQLPQNQYSDFQDGAYYRTTTYSDMHIFNGYLIGIETRTTLGVSTITGNEFDTSLFYAQIQPNGALGPLVYTVGNSSPQGYNGISIVGLRVYPEMYLLADLDLRHI
jgi:hypothetical protein